ncbi:hypothetical protein ACJ73_00250 [Blastomyces percursus]|uniref:Uncharacterized protein n=1 Tax=Blastomyces percursus TaxID=1658174 RepID=A0A1J9RII4_9EURO|nr:hypothetical protein ACJ73_00250 [Blastomyces percursus]
MADWWKRCQAPAVRLWQDGAQPDHMSTPTAKDHAQTSITNRHQVNCSISAMIHTQTDRPVGIAGY